MRYGQVALSRSRARTQFQDIYDTISELDDVYRSASTTARRSKKLLAEMDRVASTVSNQEQRKQDRTQVSIDQSIDGRDIANFSNAGKGVAIAPKFLDPLVLTCW